MARLSLDDFAWYEPEFDRWELGHKTREFTVAVIRCFSGWDVQVLFDPSQYTPIHVDSFDAAQSLAQIIASQYMEKYYEQLRVGFYSPRTQGSGPPPLRAGVFAVGGVGER